MEAQVQIDVNGEHLDLFFKKILNRFSCCSVAVKSVSIQEELVGKEDEDMVLFCTALGGRPLPTISWSMPENVEFETEDESKTLVGR